VKAPLSAAIFGDRPAFKSPRVTGASSVFYVALLAGVPTRITELSVTKSSELFGANGSATQREPLIIKAYSCRPGERGTETDQTPGAPE